MFLGGVCFVVSGITAVRWSLKYSSMGKFTVVGVFSVVAGIVVMTLTLREAFRGK